jgi:hypothetical protein
MVKQIPRHGGRRTAGRYRWLHRPRLHRHGFSGVPVYPSHPGPAFQAPVSFRSGVCPKGLKGPIGGKIKVPLITSSWPDFLRGAATMVAGAVPPSQLPRKSSAYPRLLERAVALREIGGLKDALDHRMAARRLHAAPRPDRAQQRRIPPCPGTRSRIGCQGKIRDRAAEGQYFRMAGLNLLAAIIICLEHQASRSRRHAAKT